MEVFRFPLNQFLTTLPLYLLHHLLYIPRPIITLSVYPPLLHPLKFITHLLLLKLLHKNHLLMCTERMSDYLKLEKKS
jgi:hypothetical protein